MQDNLANSINEAHQNNDNNNAFSLTFSCNQAGSTLASTMIKQNMIQ